MRQGNRLKEVKLRRAMPFELAFAASQHRSLGRETSAKPLRLCTAMNMAMFFWLAMTTDALACLT